MSRPVRRIVPLAAASGLAVAALAGAPALAAGQTDSQSPPPGQISIPLVPGVVGHVTLEIHPCVDVIVGDGGGDANVPAPLQVKASVSPATPVLPKINLELIPCV